MEQSQLNVELSENNIRNRFLDREMNELKPEIIQLYKQRQQLQTRLVAHGQRMEDINRLLEKWSYEAQRAPPGGGGNGASASSGQQRRSQHVESLPHNDERTWLIPGVDRKRAETMLAGKPQGTFLIRNSSTGQHALSIMCNGNVGHCKIEKGERGYGFAEPYYIYPSLMRLVLHYAKNSLEEHNEVLKTTLIHPIGAETTSAMPTANMENMYIEPGRGGGAGAAAAPPAGAAGGAAAAAAVSIPPPPAVARPK